MTERIWENASIGELAQELTNIAAEREDLRQETIRLNAIYEAKVWEEREAEAAARETNEEAG